MDSKQLARFLGVMLLASGVVIGLSRLLYLTPTKPPVGPVSTIQTANSARPQAASNSVLAVGANTSVALKRGPVRWNLHSQEPAFVLFSEWYQNYSLAANLAEKAALESVGIRLARDRRTVLAGLIRTDPETALREAVPTVVRRALPQSVKELLETRISGRGELTVMAALPEPGKEAAVVPVFRTATIGNKSYEAYVYGQRLGEPTRRDLPLNGIALDQLLAVSENPVRLLEPEEVEDIKALAKEAVCGVSGLPAIINNQPTGVEVGGRVLFLCHPSHVDILNNQLVAADSGGPTGGGSPSQVQASAWTEGQKNLILIRVDFSDLSGVPFSDSTGTTLVSGLNSFYTEMSYGRTGFRAVGSGSDVTPTFRMPQRADYYGTNDFYNQLRTDATNAAVAAGFVMTNYDRDVICMGAVPGWSWSGLAYVGAAGAWIRSSFGVGVPAHEIGHNYGLNHANYWDTSGLSVLGPGTSVEYGDIYDTMGTASAGIYHFNARYKSYLNWLTTNEIVSVTSNGTYRISAHDDPNSTGLRALKINRPDGTNYWVEFRQKFTSNKWLMNGASLRGAQSGNQRSLLLDTSPSSIDGKNDAGIVIGRTYADAPAGVYITPIGKGGTTPESLDVVVSVGTISTNVAPTVSIAVSDTNASTGAVLNFTATASDANGDALAYYWDFGDDNFGTNGPAASKSWSAAGEYVVRCVVSDMKGGEGSESVIVRIGSPSTFRISGQVTDEAAGTPLEGVRVYAAARMTYTDSDGTYNLVGLPAGTYTVGASLYPYNLVVSGFVNPVSIGPNATNIDFVSTAIVAPTITVQPQSQTVSSGANVTFNVTATGTGPLNYQWRFNGVSISGATTSSYTRSNVQSADAGSYSVLVSNAGGSVPSANAVLTISSAPSITTQPQSQTVVAGSDATFDVTATGSAPLSYQWRFSGGNIAGATASTYTRVNAQLADAGAYTVVVSNSINTVTSAPATLTVNFSLAATATYGGTVTKFPDQPSYAPNSVVTLTASPVTVFPFAGWSGDASGTDNPLSLIMTSNRIITANFTSPVPDIIIDNPAAALSGSWLLATAGDQYGTNYSSIGVVNHGTLATATWTPNINTGGRYDVYLWYPTIAGGLNGAQFVVTNLDGALTNSSINQSIGSGGWVLLASTRNFASGTNGFVRLANAGSGNKNVAADAVRWVYSENQIAPPLITAQPQDQNVTAGQAASLSVAVTGTRPLSYQWRLNGASIGLATNATFTISNAQSADAGPYTVLVTNLFGSITSAVATLTVIVPPGITSQPQDEAVILGQPASFSVAATGTLPLAYQWRLNEAPLADATNLDLQFASAQVADAGAYSVVITNIAGSITSAVATLTVNVPPGITTQPHDQSVLAGQPASFSVAATGTIPLSYQWYLNGATLGGSTGSTLNIANAQVPNAGAYTVAITNVAGAITSAVATLTINFALTATATYGGRVAKVPDQTSYAFNTAVTLTATPVSVFPFAGWSGDATGTNNPLTVMMNTNKMIAANFTSPVPDLIIDNPAAAFTGTWATDTTAADKFGSDYRDAGTSANNTTATATFSPTISTAGRYDIYVWYPTITKGFSAAQFLVSDADGTLTNSVNESSGSGGWLLLASGRNFAVGTNGFVRLTNLGQGGKTVVADAVRWAYNENQLANPVITSQPASQNANQGADVAFNVGASGAAPLRYQWRLNGSNIPGGINSGLSLTNVQTANAGNYTVVVTNASGMVTSAVATLTVNLFPGITFQPQDQAVGIGSNIIFHVLATGTAPLAYQWQKDGLNLSNVGNVTGATSTNLTITNAQPPDAGAYMVIVTNVAGRATSATAMLAVGYEADMSPRPTGNNSVTITDWVQIGRFAVGFDPLPTGNEFMRADCAPRSSLGNGVISLTDWVQAGRYAAGLDAMTPAGGPGPGPMPGPAESSGSEPAPAGFTNRAVHIPDATLVRGQNGDVVIELLAQGDENALAFSVSFDPAELVFKAAVVGSAATNTTFNVNTNQAGSGSLGIAMALSAGQVFTAGTDQVARITFMPVTSGSATSSVAIFGDTPVLREISNVNADALTATYQNSTITLIVVPTITAQPQSQTNCPNTGASFTVTAAGTPPLAYQWRFNGTNLAGASNTSLVLASIQSTDAGNYSVVVTNAAGAVTSSVAVLNVRLPTVASGPSPATACQGSPASFWTVASGTGPFSYDWTLDGAPTGTNSPSLSVTTGALSVGSHIVAVTVSGTCGAVTNTAALTVQAIAAASSLSPVTVCQGSAASFSTVASGTGPFSYAWTLDGAPTGTNGPSLSVTTGALSVGSHTVAVAVSGTCGVVTNGATLTINAPTAATALTNLTKVVGESATFSTFASGTGPFTYQWGKDGTSIPAATSSSYAIAAVTPGDAGIYTIAVSGACNSVTNSAVLTVNVPPGITGQPQSQAAGFGSNVTLSVSATGSLPLNYQWLKDGVNLANGVNVTGATSSVLNITSAQYGNAGVFSVTVTNMAGQTSSAPALLTVGFEGDLTPLPTGDNLVTVTDWVQIGRFVAVLDPAPTGSEFMRVDCAPRSSLGNGIISVTDWVQAGRYAAGLDPLTPAGGPSTPLLALSVAESPPQTRLVRAGSATLIRGENGEVSVELISQGDENAAGFSVNFDSGEMNFVAVTTGAGASGSTLNLNSNQVSLGRLGIAMALSPGATFTPGTNEIIRITFLPRLGGLATNGLISFGDAPVVREISSTSALVLPADYQNGVLAVVAPPPRFESVRVFGGQFQMTLTGNAGEIYDVEVSTNLSNWVPLLTLTNTLGTITFTDVAVTNFTGRYYRGRIR